MKEYPLTWPNLSLNLISSISMGTLADSLTPCGGGAEIILKYFVVGEIGMIYSTEHKALV